jgi:MFS superfamily sulfate permease-like transporter
VLAAVETSAIGRMFGQKHGNRFDANQELLAIGAGNLLSGLGRGFPVSGGMSQSLVNESSGARTPVSGLIATLFTLIVVLFATGLLRNLPQPVLAAIVLAAVMSLVDVRALRHIWHFSRASSSWRSRRCSACWDRARSTACCWGRPSRSSCCCGRRPRRA